MYLISLYFDEKTNKTLQHYIDRIAAETGNDFMTAHQVPPHLTVCQIEAKSEQELTPCMGQLQLPRAESRIEFVSVGMLLPYVLYVAPVYNAFLHALMQETYHCFQTVPQTRISRFYQPMSWLPHATVGKTLDKEQMQKAVQIMTESFAPFEGFGVRLGLASVNPHRDIVTREI